MPARAQPSTACLTLQLLVVFWLRLSREASGGDCANSAHPGNGKHAAHAFGAEIRVRQESRPVGEDEEFGEVHDRACALLTPDHPEVLLVAAQVGEEDDARLVEAGGRLEDVAAQREGGGEYRFVAIRVAGVECMQRGRGGGGYGVEDAEESVGEAFVIAPDEVGVVEIVARVHPDALGEAAANLDLAAGVEEGDFNAVDLLRVVADNGEAYIGGGVKVAVAPVTAQGRVEHLAEPVDDDRRRDLGEDGPVDLGVVVGAFGVGGQGAAGHQDHTPTLALDECALLLVGALHVLKCGLFGGFEMVRSGTAGYLSTFGPRFG